jgi:predicted DNA-binding transcriptional regulator AlpA
METMSTNTKEKPAIAMTVQQAAKLLQVTRPTIYNALSDGRLQSAPGGVAEASVIDWLRRDISQRQNELRLLVQNYEHLTTNATAE